MSERIDVTANVMVQNGPKTQFSRLLTVDAYDRFDVTVPAAPTPPGTATTTIQLVSTSTSKVHFLLVTSSHYADTLKYSVTGGPSDILLNEPQMFSGGLVALLGGNLTSFKFANGTGSDIQIQILIGRDAIP